MHHRILQPQSASSAEVKKPWIPPKSRAVFLSIRPTLTHWLFKSFLGDSDDQPHWEALPQTPSNAPQSALLSGPPGGTWVRARESIQGPNVTSRLFHRTLDTRGCRGSPAQTFPGRLLGPPGNYQESGRRPADSRMFFDGGVEEGFRTKKFMPMLSIISGIISLPFFLFISPITSHTIK